jgi:hypothetical protein
LRVVATKSLVAIQTQGDNELIKVDCLLSTLQRHPGAPQQPFTIAEEDIPLNSVLELGRHAGHASGRGWGYLNLECRQKRGRAR